MSIDLQKNRRKVRIHRQDPCRWYKLQQGNKISFMQSSGTNIKSQVNASPIDLPIGDVLTFKVKEMHIH